MKNHFSRQISPDFRSHMCYNNLGRIFAKKNAVLKLREVHMTTKEDLERLEAELAEILRDIEEIRTIVERNAHDL